MKAAARVVTIAGAALLHVTAGCAQQPPATGSKPATMPATPAVAAADTNGTGLVPAGFGTLRQDAIAIPLQLPGVLVKLTPLDESVIRTLSPDSYRALRELAESRRPAITRALRRSMDCCAAACGTSRFTASRPTHASRHWS